jgi:hypothetical protein
MTGHFMTVLGWPPLFRDKKVAIYEASHFLERAAVSDRVSGALGDPRRRAGRREPASGNGDDVLRRLP